MRVITALSGVFAVRVASVPSRGVEVARSRETVVPDLLVFVVRDGADVFFCDEATFCRVDVMLPVVFCRVAARAMSDASSATAA